MLIEILRVVHMVWFLKIFLEKFTHILEHYEPVSK